jgi:exodeoxyribonuclease VIII
MPKFTGLTKEGKESEQSKEAKTKRAAWLMDLPPRTIVVEDQEELDQVSGMMASMVKHPVARDLLNGGIRELSGFFNYEGFRCRIRIDLLQGDLLAVVDVKTALNATFEIFEKEIEKQFYYIQAWFYLIGTAKLLKKKGLQFKFIAVEKEPPYLVNVIPVGETLLSVADAHLQWALNKLKTAIETDVWLPNEQIEHVAQASDWMMNQCATEGN